MNARYQTVGLMSLIAFVMLIGQGCGSHGVRYNVDSESTETDGTQENMVAEEVPVSEYWKGQVQEGNDPMSQGAMDQPLAYNRPPQVGGSSDFIKDMKKGDSSYESLQYFTPGEGGAGGGTDYGHNYAGVPGQGGSRGPVTGFSDANPEEWARAQLGGSYSGEGLSPEHVEQDMIAKANPHYREGQGPESTQGAFHQGRGGIYQDSQSSAFGSKDLEYVRGASLSDGGMADIYFAFDSWSITATGAQALESDADWLKANPGKRVTIEGHCDQRGTQNYNLVLGKKRAEATRDYLVDLGVKPSQLKIVSYGKERPFCLQQNEDCYQQNRRGHMDTTMN